MKIIRRIFAAVLVACTAISITACQDTSWVYDYQGTKIPAGLYIAQEMTAYAQAQSHSEIDAEVNLFKQQIEGKSTEQWILDETKALSDRYAAIDKKFNELGLSLSEKDFNIIENNMQAWDSLKATYEKNGVGEKSYRLLIESQRKQRLIFDAYYEEGGIEEVKNENLLLHFKENFASVNLLKVSLETSDEELTEEQQEKNKELKVKVEEWTDKITKKEMTFNEVYDAYVHFINETEHDASDKDDEILKDEDTKQYIKKDNSSLPEKVVKAMFNDAKTDGTALLIPEENAYYICVRYDVTKNPEDFDEMREDILIDVKGEVFEEMVKQWTADISTMPTVNEAAIKRYKVKNIDINME